MMGPINELVMNSEIDAKFPTQALGIKNLCQAIPDIEIKGRVPGSDLKIDTIKYVEADMYEGKSRLVIYPTGEEGGKKIVIGWQDLREGAQRGMIVAERSLESIEQLFLDPKSMQYKGDNLPLLLKSGKFVDNKNGNYRLRTAKIGTSREDGTSGIEIGDIVLRQNDYGVLKVTIDRLVGDVRKGSSEMLILNLLDASEALPGDLRLKEEWIPAVPKDIISRLKEQNRAELANSTLDLRPYRRQQS
ncbi:hypothetical protein MUP32_06035 [Candidatus Microgenomates bacterium]|nr:hypothetical protein [Candidatus Microgenomates bacterium]